MEEAFQFGKIPLICFGNGKLNLLPGLIRKYGKNIVLVTGRSSFMVSKGAEDLMNAFMSEEIFYRRVIISGEPSPGMIDGSVKSLAGQKFDVIVGIGGGSVLDAGKAISAMLYREEPVMDFLEGVGKSEHPGTKMPYIAIPTTSGTGSEVTKNAVISVVGESGFKKSLRHDNFVPDIAIVDPSLTLNCPADITAASGTDCMSQLVEAYLSTKASGYTDVLALEGIKAVKKYLIRSVKDGRDIDARAGMSYAALTSGICLANAGLGAVHGFASSIGGMFNIPHGIICGTLLAKANEVNLRELRKNSKGVRALIKYSNLGKIFSVKENMPDEYYADSFIDHLKKLLDGLALPHLNQYGVKPENIDNICSITDIKNNPVSLTQEDLIEILKSRL
jgi:alcohol dehydrogenase class IV